MSVFTTRDRLAGTLAFIIRATKFTETAKFTIELKMYVKTNVKPINRHVLHVLRKCLSKIIKMRAPRDPNLWPHLILVSV